MEVHHHPHVEKKGFKEYFLEFIMIFLAVTLGFIAENIRESFKEHSLRKEYVRSFYEDLKTDTAKISAVIAFDQTKNDAFNTIAACYDSISKGMTNSCELNLLFNSIRDWPFQMTDRTIKQLANTGGFRLLEKADADSIIVYQNAFALLQDFQSTIFQEAQDNVRNTYNRIANFKVNVAIKLSNTGTSLYLSGKDNTTTQLFLGDTPLLNEYFNELLVYSRIILSQQEQLVKLKQEQIVLLEYFKKKYHFE